VTAQAQNQAVAGDRILEVEHVRFAYRGVQAVDDCTFGVARGKITGLIGPNGAGKSTLIELIAGGLRPASGRIRLEGTDITQLGRLGVSRMGVIRTFQLTRVLRRLTVIENVMMAAQKQSGENPIIGVLFRRRWMSQERSLIEKADAQLEWLQLDRMRDDVAGSLSGGQRRLLEIARALMAEPKLLLLDEPTAGIYPALSALIAERVLEIASTGVTILLSAHNMSFVSRVCDNVVVMDQGKVLMQGSLEDARKSPEIVEAYLGL
jgi:ABC-type branched-subunit amino acid transport system ATPase component